MGTRNTLFVVRDKVINQSSIKVNRLESSGLLMLVLTQEHGNQKRLKLELCKVNRLAYFRSFFSLNTSAYAAIR